MNTLTPLMIATLLVVSGPFAQAQDKPATTPVATTTTTTTTASAPTTVAAGKTREQVRAELDEARRRGELEPGYRWGVDTRGAQR